MYCRCLMIRVPCGGRRNFRGMIDLLSYTTMDLHAAWPVAGFCTETCDFNLRCARSARTQMSLLHA